MIIVQIIIGLFLLGLAISVFGFFLNIIIMFLVGGWSLASAIGNRMRYGTWDKPGKDAEE